MQPFQETRYESRKSVLKTHGELSETQLTPEKLHKLADELEDVINKVKNRKVKKS